MTAIKQDGPYDSRTLTKVFFGSSIALAATMVWMVLDDWSHQWRHYQRDFREVELAQAKANEDEARRAVEPKKAALEAELEKANQEVDKQSSAIREAERELRQAQAKKEAADLAYSVKKSYVDSFTYFTEESGAQNHPNELAEYREKLAKANAELLAAGLAKEEATAGVAAAKTKLEGLQAPLLAFKKHKEELEAAVNRTARKVKQIGHNFLNDWFRNEPGVDFLDPTEKPKQFVLDNLKDDYYFAQVRKVDRCQSCHLAIDRKGYEGTIVHIEGKGIFQAKSVSPGQSGLLAVELPSGWVDQVKATDVKEQLPVEPVFKGHPNLELFMSASSPHPAEKFGCTVCHMGEGQSITFTTATHSPNSEEQREEWHRKFKWEEREHWNWPQFPTRFVEASCLLCHANNRPVPGADKLNFGRETFERLACVGCHKMKGYEDEAKRGPDLRRLVAKVGSKKEWVAYWIEDPARFRPKTNMPRFFNTPTDPANATPLASPTEEEKKLAKTKTGSEESRLYDYDVRDQVEIKAVVRFLFDRSAAYMKDEEARGEGFHLAAFQAGSAARGKVLFTARGCVGCHRIETTEAEKASHRAYAPDEYGPNLYNLSYKTSPEWVMAWISNPKHYWADTRMPNLRLEKDDARDLATYLTQGEGVKDASLPGMKPDKWVDNPLSAMGFEPNAAENQLKAACQDYLEKNFSTAEVNAILNGQAVRDQPGLPNEDERLLFLGEQTVGRLGCFGCHYVKGMESRPGIGRELSDIGDKNLTQVDWGFESVSRFAEHKPAGKIRENRHEWLDLKIARPRVFDRGKVKAPLDRSRMPQFKTTAFEREALVTYLLGHTGNRKVPDEYKYKPSIRRSNVIEGEYAILRNNCKACHLLGVDRVSVTDQNGPVRQPVMDAKGEPMKSPISGEAVTARAWLPAHVVVDNIKLFGPDAGAAALEFYGDAPAVSKKRSEWLVVASGKDQKTIAEVRPELVGADADLRRVAGETLETVWEDKAAQVAAIEKGLAHRNRGGTSLDKIIEARSTEQLGYNSWDISGKEKFDADNVPVAALDDAKTFGPPHLLGEGKKVQPLWLQSFLKDPIEIRPALRPLDDWVARKADTFKAAGGPRMPTYGFSDAGTQVFSRYFAATDEERRLADVRPKLQDIQDKVKAKTPGYQGRLEIQNKVYPTLDAYQVREYFNVVIVDGVFNFAARGDVSLSRALDEKTDGYFVDTEAAHPGWYSAAYRLVTDKDLSCATCHIVRGRQPQGTPDAWAPDLARVRERLRPPYLQEWIENPKTIIPGTKMLQAFFDGKNQQLLAQPAKVQISAVVDWLMAGVPAVLEAYPSAPKAGTEVRLTSELVNLNSATVETSTDGQNWQSLDEKGFVRERSAARVTAIRVPASGKAFLVRVRDGRYTADASVNAAGD